MRKLLVLAAALTSGLAMAQSLPIFGQAVFGQAQFGASAPTAAIPVMPLWALFLTAAALWGCAYAVKPTKTKKTN